ncbi:MAG TPA: glutamine synthetase family protein [Solirubrobacteraceae bacterium]|nr:glutamine synthetase family protein [Solirubrobacteraceae bacterium]
MPAITGETAVSEVIASLRGAGVRTARISHCDLFGKCRSKELPVDRLELAVAGLGYCVISMIEDIHGNPLDLPGFAGDSSFPDMHAVADLSTGRVLPWEPDTAWFISDLHNDRGLSPRGALRRVCAQLETLGISPLVAPELEFYLLHRGESQARYGGATGLAYTAGRRADPTGAVKRMHRALDELGLEVTAAHHEFSPGQFEINLHHGPALEAADRAFLFKEAVRELAHAEGLEANFMAKPFSDSEGSSFHVHLSLGRDEENLFAKAGGEHGLSDMCLAFMAGVLAHAEGLTALGAPTINSYRRLVPESMAPTRADWGHDHRFTYIRIPPHRGAGTRVEVRAADASANPYLLPAGLLLAGLDGINRGMRPGPPHTPGADAHGRPLPSGLAAALDALEADEVLVDGLGYELVRTFVALKRNEIERERRHVSDFDWAEYAFHS